MTVKILIISVCCLLAGYFTGHLIGKSNGYKAHQKLQKTKSMDELRSDLKQVEAQQILHLLSPSSEVNRVNEGLFKAKYVHYLTGSILNAASVATVKDVKLRIEFFSKTEAMVKTDELVIYEFIRPYDQRKFKYKLDWPKEAETYKVTIVDALVN